MDNPISSQRQMVAEMPRISTITSEAAMNIIYGNMKWQRLQTMDDDTEIQYMENSANTLTGRFVIWKKKWFICLYGLTQVKHV